MNVLYSFTHPDIWLLSTLQVALLSCSILNILPSKRENSCLTVYLYNNKPQNVSFTITHKYKQLVKTSIFFRYNSVSRA